MIFFYKNSGLHPSLVQCKGLIWTEISHFLLKLDPGSNLMGISWISFFWDKIHTFHFGFLKVWYDEENDTFEPIYFITETKEFYFMIQKLLKSKKLVDFKCPSISIKIFWWIESTDKNSKLDFSASTAVNDWGKKSLRKNVHT